MVYSGDLKVIGHFALLDDIVLFGTTNLMYFLCIIKKINYIENQNFKQDEGSVYIKHDDNTYYNIQVTLLKKINKDKSMNENFIELLKFYTLDTYKNLKNNSSSIEIKEKNNEFSYSRYKIPAYIWCISVGLITTKL